MLGGKTVCTGGSSDTFTTPYGVLNGVVRVSLETSLGNSFTSQHLHFLHCLYHTYRQSLMRSHKDYGKSMPTHHCGLSCDFMTQFLKETIFSLWYPWVGGKCFPCLPQVCPREHFHCTILRLDPHFVRVLGNPYKENIATPSRIKLYNRPQRRVAMLCP